MTPPALVCLHSPQHLTRAACARASCTECERVTWLLKKMETVIHAKQGGVSAELLKLIREALG